MASPIRKLRRDLGEAINELVRHTAVEIMNDLAEKGPKWTGDLRDSYVAIPEGKGASGRTGGGFPYSINDIPKLSTDLSEIRRVTKLNIANTQPYAVYALDLEEGVFRGDRKGNFPIGKVVESGVRDSIPGFRGAVSSGEGEATSTAPLDWYRDYLKGGKMKKAIARGVKIGFKG
tara:strand:- start:83 stop:607 length:525 start_codon:yes stop_codon:yes gene_type:complete